MTPPPPACRLLSPLVVAALLAGCGDGAGADAADAVEPAVLLALDEAAASEAVVPAVIERQRAFFDAISRGDSDRLAELLQTDFEWNGDYGRSGMEAIAPAADYLGMLAGFMPASLTRVPSTYDVSVLHSDLAWVYAQRPDGRGGIVTGWDRVGGEWRASWSRDVETDLETWQANREKGQRMRSR